GLRQSDHSPRNDFPWPCEQSIPRRLGQFAVGRDLAGLAIHRICEQRAVGTMRGSCRAEPQSRLGSMPCGLVGGQFREASPVLRLRTAVADSAWLSGFDFRQQGITEGNPQPATQTIPAFYYCFDFLTVRGGLSLRYLDDGSLELIACAKLH